MPLAFGTCSESVEVYIDPKLEERLMIPPKLKGEAYADFDIDFDVWLHLQLLGAKNSFNKL